MGRGGEWEDVPEEEATQEGGIAGWRGRSRWATAQLAGAEKKLKATHARERRRFLRELYEERAEWAKREQKTQDKLASFSDMPPHPH